MDKKPVNLVATSICQGIELPKGVAVAWRTGDGDLNFEGAVTGSSYGTTAYVTDIGVIVDQDDVREVRRLSKKGLCLELPARKVSMRGVEGCASCAFSYGIVFRMQL